MDCLALLFAAGHNYSLNLCKMFGVSHSTFGPYMTCYYAFHDLLLPCLFAKAFVPNNTLM